MAKKKHLQPSLIEDKKFVEIKHLGWDIPSQLVVDKSGGKVTLSIANAHSVRFTQTTKEAALIFLGHEIAEVTNHLNRLTQLREDIKALK